MTVPIYRLNPHVAKTSNRPCGGIFLLMAFVFRIILSKNAFPGNAKLCRHICWRYIGIAVKRTGPVGIPGHQFMKHVTSQTLCDIRFISALWKIVDQVQLFQGGNPGTLCFRFC